MSDIREELLQVMTVVAATTGMTVQECIEEALKILETEKEKYNQHIKEQKLNKCKRNFELFFRGW